jgi:NAD(P)-dependent dehydrogenase (short-subunit alcohol dehydrogenase family)
VPRTVVNVSYDFSGAVVIVTGAARGQGRAHALGFAAAGADVALLDVAEPSLPTVPYSAASDADLAETAELVRSYGVRSLAIKCDVGASAQVSAAVNEVASTLGPPDVLVNNAGVESVYALADMPEEAWDVMVGTILKGSFLMSRAVAGKMIEAGRGGKIITIGSTSSFLTTPRQAHYTAAKHGLVGLNKAMALDLAPHRICCNMVCPGAIDTVMTTGLMNGPYGEWLAGVGAMTGPWNLFDPAQMLDPQEITHAVMWLGSDAAAFVTGQALLVDAGFSVK